MMTVHDCKAHTVSNITITVKMGQPNKDSLNLQNCGNISKCFQIFFIVFLIFKEKNFNLIFYLYIIRPYFYIQNSLLQKVIPPKSFSL